MNPKRQRFIKETLDFWQPYYDKALTENDAEEIINNATSFINLLIKWKLEDDARKKLADQQNVDTKLQKGVNNG